MTSNHDASRLLELVAMQRSLPEQIDAEMARLVDDGCPQVQLAELLRCSKQEVSRRIARHRARHRETEHE